MRLFVASLQSGAPPVFDFGNALDFQNGGRVDYSNISVASDATVTISFWGRFRTTSFVNILTNSASNNIIGLATLTTFRIRWGSTSQFNFTTNLIFDTWHHFVITKDSSKILRLYVDTVLNVDTLTLTSQVLNINDIGYSTLVYNFSLDELGIKKNYVANQSDINALYNSGVGNSFTDIIGSNDLNYHLDQSGNDTTAIDSGGSSNDGTLQNFDFTTSPWVDHFTGVPSLVNANVTNHTYTYVGTATEEFLQLMIDSSDQTTTGRTIDINGQTISPASQIIITDLVDNYGYNIIT